MQNAVFSIGNPLLDISAEVDASFLEKYDLTPSNAIIANDSHLPLYEELINNYEVEYIAGGAAQNTIRSLQWMLASTPKVTNYVGCIGNDQYGEKLKEAAAHDGVQTHYLVTDDHQTGTCAALITDKERSLVAYLGAANDYKKSHFDSDEIQALVSAAKFIYCAGFFVTVSIESMVALGEHAKQNNKKFILNLSAPFVIDAFGDNLKQVLPFAHIVVGNEFEAAAIGAGFSLGDDIKEIAKNLSTYLVEEGSSRTVIFTQGNGNTIIFENGQLQEFEPISIEKEDIVDVNGAGDCFMGGYLSGYIQDKSLQECVDAGHYCANFIIQQSGIKFTSPQQFWK